MADYDTSSIDNKGLFAGIGTTLWDTIWNSYWNREQMDWSQDMFGQQMDFQKNRYQYLRRDLEKAGLNPILAFGGNVQAPSGQAGAPQGATGRSSAQSMAAFLQLRNQKQTADAAMLNAEANIHNASTAEILADAERRLKAEKEWTEHETQEKLKAETKRLGQDRKTSTAMEGKLKQEALATLYDNYQRELRSELYKGKHGKKITFIDWLMRKLPFSGHLNLK